MYQNDTSLAEGNLQTARKIESLGDWFKAHLIVCSVQPGKGASPGTNQHTERSGKNLPDLPHSKVSANRAAELTGWSRPTIMTYFRAWERASDDLGIERPEDMHPGYELDWLTEEWVANHSWEKYYRTVNNTTQSAGNPPSPERQAREFEQAITSNPEFAKKAAESLRKHAPETQQITPEQVREAVRSNPEVEKVAKEEAFNRMRERAREHSSTYDPTAPHADDMPPALNKEKTSNDVAIILRELMNAEHALNNALHVAKDLSEPLTDNVNTLDRLHDLCNQIEAIFVTGGMDAELQTLLNGEN